MNKNRRKFEFQPSNRLAGGPWSRVDPREVIRDHQRAPQRAQVADYRIFRVFIILVKNKPVLSGKVKLGLLDFFSIFGFRS